jgi:hypothetical protein
MVARMTLEQIARYLQTDIITAKGALNRVGICSPAGGEDSILVTAADLRRVAQNLAMHQRGWESGIATVEQHA